MTRQYSIFHDHINLLREALATDFSLHFVKSKAQRKVIISIILILFVSILPYGLYATTYYISTVGSDVNGNGTITTPWRSLYKACTSVTKSGDIIHVGSGSFTESAYCPLSLGVSVEGEGIANTTIVSHYSASTSYGILDLKSATEGTNGNQHISGISFNGDNLIGKVAIIISKRSNVIIHDCNFTNFGEIGINFYGSSGEPTNYSTGNAVYNCVINNCSLYLTWGRGAICFSGQSGMLIHDNTITQTQRASGSNGYCIKASIVGYNKDIKIFNNTMTVLPYNGTQYSFTMEFWHSKGGIEVYNNILKGNVDFGGYGSFKGAYAYSVYFHDNICGWDATQTYENKGFQFESTTEYGIVENNVFKNITTGVYMTYGDVPGSYTDNVTIRNNMFLNNSLSVEIGGADYTPNIANTFIYNNVFYTTVGDVAIDISFQTKATVSNMNIKNNIIQGFINSPVRCYPSGTTTITGLYVTNNDMLGNGNNNLPRFIGVTPSSYIITNNISSNPLFVSTTDFHLQAGSPCIDKGIDVGLPFVGIKPDMGAFEYSVGGSNQTPQILNQNFQINENSLNGTSVGSVIATDPDAGQTLTYSILSGNTSGAFTINSSTGVLTVTNSTALNFEVTPSFAMVIKVQDSGTPALSNQATLTVNLTDVNEAPVISNQSFNVNENSANGTTVGTVIATDQDVAQTKTFSIISGNTNGAFTINSTNGLVSITNSAALNFENTPSFALVVKVQDNGTGILFSQATITISLVDVNETPVITNQSFSVNENSANGTTVGTIVASDPDAGQTKTFSIISGNTSSAFAINASTGVLSVSNSTALNFEGIPSFALVVKVQDNGVGNLSSQASITVSVIDINEAPVIVNQSFSLAENSPNGTTVGTIVASDPDAGQTKTFSIISGNISGAFIINTSTGILSVANSVALNFENTPAFTLAIKVQDNGSGSLSSPATIIVMLSDINETPVIVNQTLFVAENSVNGTTLGTVIASDPDASQTKTFSIISGNTNGAFAINATSGVLSVAISAVLNFESTPSFSLVVKVQDNGTGSLSSQATITVSVTDINEVPVIVNQLFSIPENSANGTTIGNIVASDPDAGQTKTFSIVSGNANSAFAINASTGALTVANYSSLNYEVTPNFPLSIKVQDNGISNLSSQATITVSLSDVNEVPIISNQSFSIAENSANGTNLGTIVSSDPDAGQTKTFSIVSGNTNSAFIVNPSTGALAVANSATLNFESIPSIALVVKVLDNGSGNLSSQAVITVSITDVNELPAISNQSFLIAENSANGTSVGTIIATDQDAGQTISYSILSGNTNGAFTIQASTGVLSIANSTEINFENTPSFSLGIRVQDNGAGSLSSQAMIVVTIADINEVPVISNQVFSVAENSVNGTTVGTVVASDPDAGQTKTFSIISENPSGIFTINASTGVLKVANSGALNFENTASYALSVKVQDNGVGNLSSQAIITIGLIDVNEAPQISNQSFTIEENSANGTTVGIVVASDPDAAQTKTFSIVSGNINGGFIINSFTGILTVANSAALNFENAPSFTLVIKVQDNGGLSSQANVTVSLTDMNEVPVINNQNFNVLEFSSNGTSVGYIIATDPDTGQSLSYQLTSGNTGNTFSINTSTGELSVLNSTAIDFSINPTFSLGVKIIDNGIGNLSNNAIINVNISQSSNQSPIINNQSFSIAENSANLTSIGTVVATDPDAGQTMTFTILSGNTNGAFDVNTSTGVLSVANSNALDFENTPSFALIIKVHDNGVGNLSSQAIITISLTDINEVPVITNQSFSVDENSPNGTLAGTISASDPDAGQTRTFSIVSGNTGGAFSINAISGILTVANLAELNYEIRPSFTLIIKVQDNGIGNLNSQATITVSLNDVNEAPVLTDQSFTVNENSANGTQVGTAVTTDPDAGQTKSFSIISGNIGGTFAINAATGILTIANSTTLDFETTPSFAIVVKVQDNGNGSLSSQATLTVSLADVNEAPVINGQSFSLPENSANGTTVGTVVASDPDVAQALIFSIVSGNTSGAFSINSSTGVLMVTRTAALDFENTPSYTLVIKVQDNGAGNLSIQATFTVSLSDVNEAPAIYNQSFSIAENSAIGTAIGTLVASDPDATQTMMFTIVSGNTNDAFSINASTGNLKVANSPALNFENISSFALVVKVQDNGTGNLSSQATITISISDVNEEPVIATQSFSVAENSANGTNVGTLIASDPDSGQTKIFSIISGNTNGAFRINASSGIITVANTEVLNYQVSPSFELVVKVQDNGTGNLSSQATITIVLADINQMPVITNQSFPIAENSANGTIVGTVLASDPDTGQTKTFSLVSGNTIGAFAINATTGVLTVASSAMLDFESTTAITLVIKVQDNGVGNLSSQGTITVSISDINEQPVISNQSFKVAEKSTTGTIVGNVLASDPDAAQSLTFSIISGNANNAFIINPATGVITVANSDALSYQISSKFALVIKVQDNGIESLSSQATITISLSDINEVPVISDQSFSVAENSPVGTSIGTVIATDPDANQTKTFSIVSGNTNGAFAINASSGVLTVSNESVLDFESTPSFNIIIKVQDNGAGSLYSQAIITIRLTDINETPTVPNQSFSVAEDAATGTSLGIIEIAEPDAGQFHYYFLTTGNTSKAFSLDVLTGELTVNKSTALTQGTNSTFILGILVFDNGTGNLYNTGVVIINVLPGQNQPPVISNQALSVNQDSPSGTSIGFVAATDPNSEQILTYSILSGNTNGTFIINSSTGEIVVANSIALGSELAPSIDLVIKVQDNGKNNLSNQAKVTILILRPVMPPVILNQTKSTLEHQAVGTVVGYVSAFDPNSKSSLQYSITSGNISDGFALDAKSGCITINNPGAVCFEGHPVFNLIVDVADNVGLSSEATITINIEDINETPVCNNQYFSIAENSPDQTIVGSIVAKDFDFNQTLTYAIVSGNNNDAFMIDPTNGKLMVNNTSALNFEANATFELIVSVQDNGQGNLITLSKITIGLLDINEPPVMESQALSVIENAALGTIVGYLKAQDPDKGQVVKYKIVGGNDRHTFNLDDSSGLITVADPSKLVYGRNPLIALSVLAQDNCADSLSILSVITIKIVPDSTQNALVEAKQAPVPDIFGKNDISIYPNPTADIVNINLAKDLDQPVSIKIFNMNGQEIFALDEINKAKITIDMGTEKSGTYIAKINKGSQMYSERIIVQK